MLFQKQTKTKKNIRRSRCYGRLSSLGRETPYSLIDATLFPRLPRRTYTRAL